MILERLLIQFLFSSIFLLAFYQLISLQITGQWTSFLTRYLLGMIIIFLCSSSISAQSVLYGHSEESHIICELESSIISVYIHTLSCFLRHARGPLGGCQKIKPLQCLEHLCLRMDWSGFMFSQHFVWVLGLWVLPSLVYK